MNNTSKMHMKSKRGASLLEILAYVAIVGLVAAIAIPAVQKARKNAAYNAFPKTLQGVQASVQSLVDKPGGLGYPPFTSAAAVSSLNMTGTTFLTTTPAAASKALTLDTILRAERLMENPLNIGLGSNVTTPTGTAAKIPLWNTTTNSFYTSPDAVTDADYTNVVRIVSVVASTAVPGIDGSNYYTDASNTNLAAGLRVVSIVIPNITGTDAAALANTLNNNATASATAANTIGRVAYAAPSATTGLTTAYVYVGSW